MYPSGSVVVKRFKREFINKIFYDYSVGVKNLEGEYYNFKVFFSPNIVPPVFGGDNTAFIELEDAFFSVKTWEKDGNINKKPVIYIKKFKQRSED